MDGAFLKDLSAWQACETPGSTDLRGDYALLEPLDWGRHADGLYEAVGGAGSDVLWHYMAVGPFTDGPRAFAEIFERERQKGGWRTMVIRSASSGEILGMASYMRLREAVGSAEVGCVAFGDKLKRTCVATDAIHLMAAHLFEDLGYRRFEWKCDDQNAASMRAAVRFGFVYEGTFRQDMVVKGRNRDTAWYAMLDRDWLQLKAAFRAWMASANFDENGVQKAKLEAYRAAL